MENRLPTVAEMIEAVRTWAERQQDIRALAVVGSHACSEARSDSDIDLILLAPDPARYLRQTAWVSVFGEAVESYREDWGNVQSLRVRFRDAPEVEFGFAGLDWAALPPDSGTSSVLRGGCRTLIDRDGLLARVLAATENRSNCPETDRRGRGQVKGLLFALVTAGVLACTGGRGGIDYSLLQGTWSESGSCSSSLRIFTPEGWYFWLREENGAREVYYAGVFVTDSVATRTLGVPGAIFIAEQPNSDAGSALLAIRELSRTRIVFEVLDADGDEGGSGIHTWVRCSPGASG